MIYGMYLSTMGAMVEQAKHETVANNLANAETDGFKPDYSIFKDIPAESVMKGMGRRESDLLLEKTGGGVWMDSTASNFRQGPLVPTGVPLQMAIEDKIGSGTISFFQIRPQGEQNENRIAYTRNGNFSTNEEGMLVTDSGDYVLSPDGETINIPEHSTIKIGPDGSISILVGNSQENVVVGQVGLASIPLKDAQVSLKKLGDNLFEPDEGISLNPGNGNANIHSGSLEKSGTDPVYEMVKMIEGHRAYDLNMRFLSMQDQTLGSAVSRINGKA